MLQALLRTFRQFDWVLMGAVFVMFCLGDAIIYSVGLGKEPQNLYYFQKQTITFLVMLPVVFLIGCINYRKIKNFSAVSYVIMCGILVAVLFFGQTIRGTKGWFYFGSFGFQPAELAKIGLVLALAQYFHAYTRQIHQLRHVIVSAVIALISAGLVMFQPDFGTALILVSIWLGVILMSGIPKRYIASLGIIAAIALTCAWLFLFKDYQKDRVLAFINPAMEQQGRSYNVNQSLIAIGGGGLLGQGLGFGSQSHLKFLPENQTDFIFAVIAEELGFLGIFTLISLWAMIFYRLTVLMRRARDDFALFTALGIALIFIIQVSINIGGNLGILPITGIVLPFISYGGSALVAAMLMVGIVQSLASHSG